MLFQKYILEQPRIQAGAIKEKGYTLYGADSGFKQFSTPPPPHIILN
ncbi:MAG: hypothetical protein LBK73_00135 [Treponema sp.]|nr:hypothetical protein [Treponema sp.]